MRKKTMCGLIWLICLYFGLSSCAKKDSLPEPIVTTTLEESNPFFSVWTAPFETPPFDKIKEEHFRPAFQKGIAAQKTEIDAIVDNAEPPTFANTIEAEERSGALLERIKNVFDGLSEANTNDALQKVETEISPLLAKNEDDINLNPGLFKRVKTVYEQRDSLGLNGEQNRLLEKTYKNLVRGGANLDEAGKAELRKINEELSLLTVKFNDNVLSETNDFALIIERQEDLAGLPPSVVQAAADAAQSRHLEGRWIFTLQKPSLIPFLQYSQKRDLREKIFMAYINQANNGNGSDNKAVLARIAALWVKKARLLGYKSYADFVLEENMAKIPSRVYKILDQLWTPSLRMAKKEARDLQALIAEEGGRFKLEPWDWWYYTEKLKKAKYDFDDQLLRPYFKLDNVLNGAFAVANKLWGLQFVERTDIPKYHPDVRIFEVKEANGAHIGILYTDYFPRESKRGGAWSGTFRSQSIRDDRMITPLVYNVGNFSMPSGDVPSLLSYEEATTLFHEFGHSLQDLLSHVTYETLSGTNVPLDYVELCSQIMENWAGASEVIKSYARHYKTGEPIPDALLQKIKDSGLFNKGFEMVEYLAACYLDMDWTTLTEPIEKDPIKFEDASMTRIGMIPQIVVRYRSPYFAHVFSDEYSAGYYSYIWSEVLDADAFQAFKATSLYDQATAKSFRENILSRGGTEDPMVLYKRFRGREPKVEPLLREKGLLNQP